MWDTIRNPLTGRSVKVTGRVGRYVINRYLMELEKKQGGMRGRLTDLLRGRRQRPPAETHDSEAQRPPAETHDSEAQRERALEALKKGERRALAATNEARLRRRDDGRRPAVATGPSRMARLPVDTMFRGPARTALGRKTKAKLDVTDSGTSDPEEPTWENVEKLFELRPSPDWTLAPISGLKTKGQLYYEQGKMFAAPAGFSLADAGPRKVDYDTVDEWFRDHDRVPTKDEYDSWIALKRSWEDRSLLNKERAAKLLDDGSIDQSQYDRLLAADREARLHHFGGADELNENC
jgi:hypothetical protein